MILLRTPEQLGEKVRLHLVVVQGMLIQAVIQLLYRGVIFQVDPLLQMLLQMILDI